MEKINYKGQRINLNFEPQMGSLGRPFRLSGTKKDCTKEPKFINGVYKFIWTISFRYLDELDGFFAFVIGYNDEVLEVIKNY